MAGKVRLLEFRCERCEQVMLIEDVTLVDYTCPHCSAEYVLCRDVGKYYLDRVA